jgi:serine/threonine protein kinase
MNTTLTPEARNWQHELPGGLLLQKELVGSQAWEAIDERCGADEPVARVIRFVPVEPAWRSAVLFRLQRLASTRLTHVETPLETGWIAGQSVLYLVERPYQSLLVTRLSAQGLPVDEAQSIFKTLVAGVEELHALRLFHGDLRPGNILVRQVRPVLEVGIGNAVTGPLQFWAGGRIVNDELHRYLPPETNGAITEPSAAADLYALGVIGCELFLGHRAMQTLAGKSIELRQALKVRGVSRATRSTLLKLLDTNPQNRPRQAEDIQRLMQAGVPVWLERTVLAVVIVLLFAVAIYSGLSTRTLSSKLNAAGNDLNAAQTQITSLTRDNKDILQKLQESESRLGSEVDRSADLRKQIEDDQTQITSSANGVSAIRLALEDSTLTREKLVTRIQRIIGQPVPAAEQLWGDYRQSLAAGPADDQQSFDDWVSSYQPAIAETDTAQLRSWRQQVTAVREAQAGTQPVAGYQQEPWSQAAQQQQAQAIWKQWCAGSLSAKALFESLRKARSKLPQSHPVDHLLTQWQRPLAGLGTAAGSWLTARTGDAVAADIAKRVHTALQTPWDTEAWTATETYCRAAGRAAAIWNQFAHQRDLSWDQFSDRLTNSAAAESKSLQSDVEESLRKWIGAFNEKSGAVWKLQLVKGEVKAPKGETEVPDYGKDRLFNLDSGDDYKCVPHSWSGAAAHSYEKSKHEFVEFHWKVGEPIELLLEEDDYTTNLNLVEQVFDGPVSIWRLHTQRRISIPETGVSLDFRIIDCPGPPREVLKDITPTLGRVSAP